MDMKTKICTKCGEGKTLENYYKDIRRKDGRASECKSCINIRHKKYNAENKQQQSEYQKEYRKSDKGKAAHAKYRKSNKGKLIETKYRKSDKRKATNAKYFKTDKGKATKARDAHNRRIKIANTLCTLDDKQFNYIVHNLQNTDCACCGRTFTKKLIPTRDHIYPVSKGGDFTIYTVQALCKSCDSKKGTKYIDYRSDYHKEMIRNMI